jgi:hypothetical protein
MAHGAYRRAKASMEPETQQIELPKLLTQCWMSYERSSTHEFVIKPAIPILFFGDSKRYFSSSLKVITVGLNPSRKEFPDHDRFSRFPAVREATQRTGSQHLAALDAYFYTDPYKQWFASFEPILNGLECSYYTGHDNRALHTDLCSPIATSPTWGKLSKQQRSLLEPDGLCLWHLLVKALMPDIILVSVAERYLQHIQFRSLAHPQLIWSLDRQRPFDVWGTPIQVHASKPSLQVFGRAAQTPFGKVSRSKKVDIGAAIKEEWKRVCSR